MTALSGIGNSLFDALTADVWAGALLGIVLSAAVVGMQRGFVLLHSRTTLRLLLGDLVDRAQTTAIYVREMDSDGTLFSYAPQYIPGVPPQRLNWQNMRGVLPREDVLAASDIVNLLGRAGKAHAIEWRSVQHDWDRWDEPLICVGGHPKGEAAIGSAANGILDLSGFGFYGVRGMKFGIGNGLDHGIIARLSHPATSKTMLVVMGHSGLSTRAAAYFLQQHALRLGSLLPATPFCAVVSVSWTQGRDSATLVALSEVPKWWRVLLHPIVAWRWRRAIWLV